MDKINHLFYFYFFMTPMYEFSLNVKYEVRHRPNVEVERIIASSIYLFSIESYTYFPINLSSYVLKYKIIIIILLNIIFNEQVTIFSFVRYYIIVQKRSRTKFVHGYGIICSRHPIYQLEVP